MYIVRDIFNLKFGHFKDAKASFDEVKNKNMLPIGKSFRVLSDFTGDSYRLIMETGFETLSEYEQSMSSGMNQQEWQQWYEKFKPLVNSSHREILKQVM